MPIRHPAAALLAATALAATPARADDAPQPRVQELLLAETPWTQESLQLQIEGGTGWEHVGDEHRAETPLDLELGLVDRWQIALGGALRGEHDEGWTAGAGALSSAPCSRSPARRRGRTCSRCRSSWPRRPSTTPCPTGSGGSSRSSSARGSSGPSISSEASGR